MLSFKDFLAVQYTGGESEQQDLNAKKRHAGVVGEDKLEDRLAKAKGQEMVKAHHKKLGADPQAPAQVKKARMAKVSVTQPIGHRIADIGPGGKEHNVQTKDWPAERAAQ